MVLASRDFTIRRHKYSRTLATDPKLSGDNMADLSMQQSRTIKSHARLHSDSEVHSRVEDERRRLHKQLPAPDPERRLALAGQTARNHRPRVQVGLCFLVSRTTTGSETTRAG